MRTWISLLLLASSGCREPAGVGGKVCPDTDQVTDDTDVVPETGPVEDDDFSGLDMLPCGQGSACAASSELLGGTCCAWGDPLTVEGSGYFNEAVDLETNGEIVALCGGFGPAWSDIGTLDMQNVPKVSRCQRIAYGPEVDGEQIVYFAHHGDDWVPTPGLWVYRLGKGSEELQKLEEDVLYEGMATTSTHLFSASHGSGLGAYAIAGDGTLTPVGRLGGFENATHVEVAGDRAYVTDERMLEVVDVSNPEDMVLLDVVQLDGQPRNLDVVADRIYVALGNDGLAVLDRSTLALEARLEPDGSVQDVGVEDGLIALANWTHVSVWDDETLALLGTQRVKDRFEQDLGINLVDGRIYVAEWQGLTVLDHHPGLVAPDLWIPDEMYVFDGETADEVLVEVENRGPVDLALSDIHTTDPDRFVVDAEDQVVRAGEEAVFELRFEPPGAEEEHRLQLCSNDPDDVEVDVPLFSQSHATRLNVGDTLTEQFAFLDPTGQDDLSQLEGNVLVLAYFALF